MINVHTIDLDYDDYQKLLSNSYLIMQPGSIVEQDFVLFRRLQQETTPEDSGVEVQNEDDQYTGEYRMTQIMKIETDDGLKEGYAIVTMTMY